MPMVYEEKCVSHIEKVFYSIFFRSKNAFVCLGLRAQFIITTTTTSSTSLTPTGGYLIVMKTVVSEGPGIKEAKGVPFI